MTISGNSTVTGTYSVSVLGEDMGRLEWRGHRLMWIEPDGTQHLYYRDASLHKVRASIASALRVPAKQINITRNK